MKGQNPKPTTVSLGKFGGWRRRRDSNPRDGFPPTPLAGERLRPLGHVSADGYILANDGNTRRNFHFALYSDKIVEPFEITVKHNDLCGLWARIGQFFPGVFRAQRHQAIRLETLRHFESPFGDAAELDQAVLRTANLGRVLPVRIGLSTKSRTETTAIGS